MALLSGEIAQILWAETKSLGDSSADGSGDVNQVRKLVARLVASADGAGFGKREAPPSLNDPQFGGAVRALMSIVDTAVGSTPPERRMIFWAAGDEKERPTSKSNPQPPSPWNTIPVEGIIHHGRFALTNGREIDVFSRAAVDGDTNDPIFVNAITGTGVPGGRVGLLQMSQTKAKPKVGFRLFVAACIAFVAAAVWTYGVGIASRQTVLMFNAEKPVGKCSADPTAVDFVFGPPDWRYAGGKPSDCQVLYGKIQQKVAQRETIEQTSLDRFASWALTTSGDTGWSVSLFWPLALGLVSLTLLFVSAGYGINGRPLGVIIDGRYRMSLTLAQLALWSIVILGGWLVVGLYNFGFGGLTYGALDQAAAANPTVATFKDMVKAYNLIPSIPRELMAVLGLSAASPFISRLITNTSLVGSPEEAQATKKAESGAVVGAALRVNAEPAEAALADMVMNETEGSNDLVDPTRVQYAAMTGILVVSYITLLFDSISSIEPTRTVLAASKPIAVITSLPSIDATFIALLFVSHAALWGSKIYDKKTGAGS